MPLLTIMHTKLIINNLKTTMHATLFLEIEDSKILLMKTLRYTYKNSRTKISKSFLTNIPDENRCIEDIPRVELDH
jgi:hypothetical protein